MADDEIVESLLIQWDEARAGGRDLTPEELCRDRPDLLDRVRAGIDAVCRVEGVNARLGSTVAAECRAAAPEPDHLRAVDTVLEQRGGDELGWVGRFRALRILGVGGMGVVLAAEDTLTRRRVALKVMRPDRLGLPRSRERFLREARAAAALQHDNLMPVYEAGEQVDKARPPYLVMPLYDGETLADRLARGPVPPPELARLGHHVLLGLAAAHRANIIHRDLKPSNVWLEALPDGDHPWRARIMDFGLALDLTEVERLTATGFRVGTPEYMSPEQTDARQVTCQTDLFGVGVVLYEAATGGHPFGPQRSLFAMLDAIARQPADPVRLRAACAPPVADLILRLLAKSPADRPASATAAAAELRAAAGG